LAGLQVLYEDNHLLAVVKPAGVATMGAPAGQPTLLEMARQYLKQRYHKPGRVYLGVVSRLDAPVTGVVLFARTSKAARRLTRQFRTRQVRKIYWAMVEGRVEPPSAEYSDWVAPDDERGGARIAASASAGAKEARLRYRRLRLLPSASLLEIELHTGRKHQIRLQLAVRGHPVLGDRKYGSRRPFAAGIALHARRLALVHPVKGGRLEIVAPLPRAWRKVGLRDGEAGPAE
jgi:23S rRNA pseudouridine1911/1915/1917 synthase